ncbi:MAG: hypothetical protein HYS02_00835, partial [Candidatus Staskawiczbacteria bacterium]|nr:hypothetical protein [Candidatus Staskawiczbacteria bacterium]
MPINPESKDPANKLENQKTEQFKPGQILDEGETMEKPEQQATPQPEKIQDGADLDIDAAKKYLDEVYGREKSGAGKVKPLVQKEEQKPKFFVPEEIGQKRTQEQVEEYKKIREEGQKIVEKKKEIGKRESLAEEKRKKEDMPSALDLAYERAKKISQETTNEGENKPEAEVKEGPIIIGEVEKKQQQELAEKVETAKNELIDLSKKIAENREAVYNAINSELGEKEKIKTEMSLYDKAKEVFEIATGESLEKTAKERTKIEVENEGLRIVTIKEYREKKTAETQEKKKKK